MMALTRRHCRHCCAMIAARFLVVALLMLILSPLSSSPASSLNKGDISVGFVLAFSAATVSQFPPPSQSSNSIFDNDSLLSTSGRRRSSKSYLPVVEEEQPLVSRRYQLEEQEDRNNCITEVLLLEDHTVVIGQSDGPLFDLEKSYGIWSYNSQEFTEDIAYAMKVCRTYNTGSKRSDMGEFSFSVCRVYIGEVVNVGNVLGVEGSIYEIPDDENDDDDLYTDSNDSSLRSLLGISSTAKRVGFFSMIDTTPQDDEEDGDDGGANGTGDFDPPRFV